MTESDVTVEGLIAAIAEGKATLDALRARVPWGIAGFDHAQDLELTYTSNAIEGNLLTAEETTAVVERGIAIGGKPLKDHLEALDHMAALRHMRALAREKTRLTQMDLRDLHRLVMLRSEPDLAGRYADRERHVVNEDGRQAFPSPAAVPGLMADFVECLIRAPSTPATAFEAHRQFVEIHPHNDGNGRTGRLLMNLVLLRAGYPPVSVRPVDRPAYIDALRQSQAGQGSEAFGRLLCGRLLAALDEHCTAYREALAAGE